jgi:LPS export ABC transporter protein LptC
MPRRTIALIVVLLLIGGIAMFLSFAPQPSLEHNAVAEASGVVMRGYDSEGNLSWEAQAEEGEILTKAGSLRGVTVDLYSQTSSALHVTADRLSRDGETATLEGGVTAEREDGLRVETDRLVWSQDQNLLHAGETQIAYESTEVTGSSLEYDLRSGKAELTGVTAQLSGESPGQVTAEKAEVAGSAVALVGNVELSADAGSFSAERLDTTLDGQTMHLSGGVTAASEGVRASAEAMDLTPEGWSARGSVQLDVETSFLGGSHGS